MTPLVSILIPAYNAQEWIAATLESAVAQTWQHKEIIVVDDGSTDRTLAIAQRFASRGVNVVCQKNAGAAAARNKCFSVCRGDYVQWLDADDLLAPDKIAKQMQVAEHHRSHRTLLSSPWGRFIYRRSRAEFRPTVLWRDLKPAEWLLQKMDHNLHMQTATWLVSRELTEAAGPWNTQLLGDDDGEYFCRVLLQSDGVRFVPDARVFYRMAGPGSLSYIWRSNNKLDAQLHSMRLHISYLRSLDDSDRTRAACVRYLQTWLVFFYPERPDLVKQAEQLAMDLGGRLGAPRLSWKYWWLGALFGRDVVKRAQVILPRMKWSLIRLWDKALFRVERLAASGDA
jgi:glycosyltransferase involved in cell wall biosynthesis